MELNFAGVRGNMRWWFSVNRVNAVGNIAGGIDHIIGQGREI